MAMAALGVNGPEDGGFDWNAIKWRTIEADVRRLRQRIFTASQAGDLARVRNLQKLMLRSLSNTLVSVRQVTSSTATLHRPRAPGACLSRVRGQPASTVLRGPRHSNAAGLPDQALKGPKRHQAVSGYWHTLSTLAAYCRVRSYWSVPAATTSAPSTPSTTPSPATPGSHTRNRVTPRPTRAWTPYSGCKAFCGDWRARGATASWPMARYPWCRCPPSLAARLTALCPGRGDLSDHPHDSRASPPGRSIEAPRYGGGER